MLSKCVLIKSSRTRLNKYICKLGISAHQLMAAIRIKCDLPPPAAPPYKTSVAFVSNANACFGNSSISISACVVISHRYI